MGARRISFNLSTTGDVKGKFHKNNIWKDNKSGTG